MTHDPRPTCIDCGLRWVPEEGVDATKAPCPICRTSGSFETIRTIARWRQRASLAGLELGLRWLHDRAEELRKKTAEQAAKEAAGVPDTLVEALQKFL